MTQSSSSGSSSEGTVSRLLSKSQTPHAPCRNFLSITDLQPNEIEECLTIATELKAHRSSVRPEPTSNVLGGSHVALLFEKPSLRTRTTFEIAVHELGGHVVEPQQAVTFGDRESPEDVARNLERWISIAVIRTFAQHRLEQFAAAAPGMHVINALTNEEHPCQALADLLTLKEHWKDLRGGTLAFIGDSNNVATSIVHACMMLGVNLNFASPANYELPTSVREEAARLARHGAKLQLYRDPAEAVQEAHAVYTDAWTSMGQEEELAKRQKAFMPYQVNTELMAQAKHDALFMHCLPAHRGQEVTDEVLDSPNSIVFEQAENRLHTQKAILLMMS